MVRGGSGSGGGVEVDVEFEVDAGAGAGAGVEFDIDPDPDPLAPVFILRKVSAECLIGGRIGSVCAAMAGYISLIFLSRLTSQTV